MEMGGEPGTTSPESVPSMTRCGGVAVIKPKSIAYADNAHS